MASGNLPALPAQLHRISSSGRASRDVVVSQMARIEVRIRHGLVTSSQPIFPVAQAAR